MSNFDLMRQALSNLGISAPESNEDLFDSRYIMPFKKISEKHYDLHLENLVLRKTIQNIFVGDVSQLEPIIKERIKTAKEGVRNVRK